jgi:hypothetical protein
MYTMRPDFDGMFGSGLLFGVRPQKPTSKVSLPQGPSADAFDLLQAEKCVETIPTKPKSTSHGMKGAGCRVVGEASFNPHYVVAGVHTARHVKKEKKKALPGEELLDMLLKSKRAQSTTGKGIGMKGRGFQFEGEWFGDNWMKQESNQRRELIGSGCEHLGKGTDFDPEPTGPYDMEPNSGGQVGGGGKASKSSWIEPMKRTLTSTVVPALLHYKGLDDLDGRRKIGKGGGWAAHFESYAKTLRGTSMSEPAVDKFCKQVAATVVDYVNGERRRHNAPDIDKQQRYRLAKSLMAYIYSRTHTDVGDEYFWSEVLPYVLHGRLVAWGHLKTGGSKY